MSTPRPSTPDDLITRGIRIVGLLIAVEQAAQEVVFHVPASAIVTGMAALMMAGAPAVSKLIPTREAPDEQP